MKVFESEFFTHFSLFYFLCGLALGFLLPFFAHFTPRIDHEQHPGMTTCRQGWTLQSSLYPVLTNKDSRKFNKVEDDFFLYLTDFTDY